MKIPYIEKEIETETKIFEGQKTRMLPIITSPNSTEELQLVYLESEKLLNAYEDYSSNPICKNCLQSSIVAVV